MKKIAVIDYGMSNLHSVIKSFQKASDKRYKLCVVTSEKKLKDASMIILPGQGAAKSCMQKLSESFPNLSDFILNKPFLEYVLASKFYSKNHSKMMALTVFLSLKDQSTILENKLVKI